MRILQSPAPILTAGFAVMTSAAAADVTALDVWESWKSMAEGLDQSITVEEETYSGGVLSLLGVTSTMATPDGSAEGTLSELTLTEESDGSVTLTMPPEYPISVTSTGPDGAEVSVGMRFQQTGLTLVASGEPGAINYVFAAPTITMILDEITEDGDTPIDMALSAQFSDMAGAYSVTDGTPQSVESDFTAASLAIDLSMIVPDEGNFEMSFNMEDLASSSKGSISPFSGGRDLASMLREGMTSQGTLTMGPSQYSASFSEGENPFEVTGSTASGHLDVDLSNDGIRYSGGNTGVAAELAVSSMPLPPFNIEIAESSGEVRMPLIATEESKDFGIKLDFAGLAASDTVWGMLDPTGALPREPADVQLDIAGQGKWLIDIADPEAMADPAALGGMPGEVETLTLNNLLLSVLGAELTGSGDFQFNNEAVIPMPSGAIDLQLVGGNGILDKLVAAGLVPEEQAMGARMMLGLFARPGEGPDTLVSTIELQEDGSVLANGQRIR